MADVEDLVEAVFDIEDIVEEIADPEDLIEDIVANPLMVLFAFTAALAGGGLALALFTHTRSAGTGVRVGRSAGASYAVECCRFDRVYRRVPVRADGHPLGHISET